MAQMRGSHDSIVKTGLWNVAAPILFVLDLIYPNVTRILLQYATCRHLGKAGWWLEASYSIECHVDSYNAYLPMAIGMGALYSLGWPVLSFYLVKRFQDRGKSGDKVVQPVKILGTIL